jgi:hypothetical protein
LLVSTPRLATLVAAITMLTMGAGPAAGALAGADEAPRADALDRLPPLAQAGLGSPGAGVEEARGLADAMHAAPTTSVRERLDLAVERAHGLDVDAELGEPGSLADELAASWRQAGQPDRAADVDEDAGQAAPPAVREAAAWVLEGAREAEVLRPDVAGSLSDEVLWTLAQDARPGEAYDGDRPQRAALLGDAEPTELAEHQALLAPVDLERAGAAHLVMAEAVDRAVATLEQADLAPPAGSASSPGDVLEQPTPYGPIVVTGADDDTYTEEALLTVDLGGDDTYENRAGAVRADVLGLTGTSPPPAPTAPGFEAWAEDTRERVKASHNASVSIDLAGQDTYVHPGPGTQGYGGFGGFGALVDLQGQDLYKSRVLAQGTGQIAGAGVLVDAAGDDRYDVTLQGQGYAQDAGLGLLVDGAGNDEYRSFVLGQGTGFIAGLLGGLVDGSGDDTYTCDGIADFSDSILPVVASRPGSTCQGTGFGGNGLLADGAGDDDYETASSFRNAALLGAGVHVDGGGTDRFDGAEWSNGVGALGASVLVAEGTGDNAFYANQTFAPWIDVYVGANGEGYTGVGALVTGTGDDTLDMAVDKGTRLDQYACGAGCSFEGGTGLVASAGGDDVYRSEVGQGGSVGGQAALLDAAGDDTYERLYDSTRVQGYVETGLAPAGILVGSCNAGLLVDAAGQDSYDNPTTDFGQRADDRAWGQGDYGRGMDGTGGIAEYGTSQGPEDLQEIVDREACQQVANTP